MMFLVFIIAAALIGFGMWVVDRGTPPYTYIGAILMVFGTVALVISMLESLITWLVSFL